MKKVKCTKGHFFDLDRSSACPICGAGVGGMMEAPVQMEQGVPEAMVAASHFYMEPEAKFVAEEKPVFGTEPEFDFMLEAPSFVEEPVETKSVAPSSTESELPKTMAYYEFEDVTPPVGWLVCIEGVNQGESYICVAGPNRIGRSENMDIVIKDDTSVSRENHAVILYEPKQKKFYLQAGTSDNLTYKNDTVVFSNEELQAYDKITLGKTDFIFMPLCGEHFSWDEYLS